MAKINMIEMPRIISDRSTALNFLCRRFERENRICCPSCNSKKYYVVSRGNLRCASCRTAYRPFESTCFGTIRVDFVKWLVLIKLFALETGANQAATEADTSYPATLRAFESL